jgi:2-dehydropantoate 2-reductase
MRILVVGAGAIGGYFGGRMLAAGSDVTFLVRPKRAAELADAGLVIKSPVGDVTLKNPPIVQAGKFNENFDVVLLSCKAFDLDDAIKVVCAGSRSADLDHPAAQRHAAS